MLPTPVCSCHAILLVLQDRDDLDLVTPGNPRPCLGRTWPSPFRGKWVSGQGVETRLACDWGSQMSPNRTIAAAAVQAIARTVFHRVQRGR